MPAQVCSQSPKAKEVCRQAIRAKIESTKMKVVDNVDEEVPAWISWALKPLVSVAHDLIRSRDDLVGGLGETKAYAALRLILPSECILINDMVLEVEVDEFIQVDHTVIAPSGIFLVETKAWQGAVLCNRGAWKRKSGNSWVRCTSPTGQNRRHRELLQRWLTREVPGLPAGDWVHLVILFTRASWVKVNGDEMPVFDDCLGMAWHIRKLSLGSLLSDNDRKRIVSAVLMAKPADRSQPSRERAPLDRASKPGPTPAQEGRTEQGRRYVRVHGTREDADGVRREYLARNANPGEVRADRRDPGIWFFYLQ